MIKKKVFILSLIVFFALDVYADDFKFIDGLVQMQYYDLAEEVCNELLKEGKQQEETKIKVEMYLLKIKKARIIAESEDVIKELDAFLEKLDRETLSNKDKKNITAKINDVFFLLDTTLEFLDLVVKKADEVVNPEEKSKLLEKIRSSVSKRVSSIQDTLEKIEKEDIKLLLEFYIPVLTYYKTKSFTRASKEYENSLREAWKSVEDYVIKYEGTLPAWQVYIYRGRIQQDMKKFDDAVETFEHVISAKGSLPSIKDEQVRTSLERIIKQAINYKIDVIMNMEDREKITALVNFIDSAIKDYTGTDFEDYLVIQKAKALKFLGNDEKAIKLLQAIIDKKKRLSELAASVIRSWGVKVKQDSSATNILMPLFLNLEKSFSQNNNEEVKKLGEKIIRFINYREEVNKSVRGMFQNDGLTPDKEKEILLKTHLYMAESMFSQGRYFESAILYLDISKRYGQLKLEDKEVGPYSCLRAATAFYNEYLKCKQLNLNFDEEYQLYQETLELLSKLWPNTSYSEKASLLSADELVKQGKYDEAISVLERILPGSPVYLHRLTMLADIMYKKYTSYKEPNKDLKQTTLETLNLAMTSLEKAIENAENKPISWILEKKDFLFSVYEKACRIYLENKEPEKVIGLIGNINKFFAGDDYKSSILLGFVAIAYVDAKKLKEAETLVDTILNKFKPNAVVAQAVQILGISFESSDPVKSAKYLVRWLDLLNDLNLKADLTQIIAATLKITKSQEKLKTKDIDALGKVVKVYEKILEHKLGPLPATYEEWMVELWYAQALFQMNDLQKAQVVYERLMKEKPKQAVIIKGLADVYFVLAKSGDKKKLELALDMLAGPSGLINILDKQKELYHRSLLTYFNILFYQGQYEEVVNQIGLVGEKMGFIEKWKEFGLYQDFMELKEAAKSKIE